jgi:hypothetical protein
MSNDGIEPDELWAQTTAVPVTPPPSGTVTRQLVVIGASSFVAMLIVGLIVTLSLGGDDSSTTVATTSTSTSTSVVPSTTLAASIATTLVPTTVEEMTTTSITTTIVEVKFVDQSITIADSQGISHIADSKTTLVDSQSWDIAFRLPDGTFIAQHVPPEYQQLGDTNIYRVGATTSAIRSVVNPANEWLRLHDVYTESGSIFVLYSLSSGLGLEDAQEELLAFELNTGLTTSFGMIGGWESGTSRLTYGSNIIAGEFFAEADTGPFFLHLDGYTTNPNDFGLADSYSDCSVCPSKFTVDPSGQRLAWIEADLLVVLDRMRATRVAEIRLPQGSYTTIESLDLLGDLILINTDVSHPQAMGKPILMSFNGTSTILEVAGTATFDQ